MPFHLCSWGAACFYAVPLTVYLLAGERLHVASRCAAISSTADFVFLLGSSSSSSSDYAVRFDDDGLAEGECAPRCASAVLLPPRDIHVALMGNHVSEWCLL